MVLRSLYLLNPEIPKDNRLVGGLEHEFYFPIYEGNVIIPIRRTHIFQRGR